LTAFAVRAAFAIAGASVAIAGLVSCAGDSGAGSAGRPVPRPTVAPKVAPLPAVSRHPHGPVPTIGRQPAAGRFFAIAGVRRGARVPLYVRPGRRLVKSLSAHTAYGSPQVLGVVRQRGSWLGVSSSLRPDGRLGWVRFDPAKLLLYWTRYSIVVSLSKRTLAVRYGDRVLGRYPVTVGAAGSDTPQGRFGITDALRFGESPFYGCCALALTGHQEHLPPGWLGGDRIAIHGTPGPVGLAESHGCIRATDETMRTLFRRVPLGTPVFVAA
jgi:hypothetical protein